MNEPQLWVQQQEQLTVWLAADGHEPEALALALHQHAQVHAGVLAQPSLASFEDEVLAGLGDAQLRCRPAGAANSIAWLLWHCARIEDVTTNLLIVGQPQVLEREGWLDRLKLATREVGTAMGEAQVTEVTAQLDLVALRAYRQAVGRSTRQTLQTLPPERLHQRVAPAQIQHLLAAGVLSQGAEYLAEVWGGWTLGDLIKQPAIRHSFVHLDEAHTIKQKVIGGDRR
jgi:hypothetical protein